MIYLELFVRENYNIVWVFFILLSVIKCFLNLLIVLIFFINVGNNEK